eukprot:scaffold11381_cov68-Phaeocystis_antarctica.AAC.2
MSALACSSNQPGTSRSASASSPFARAVGSWSSRESIHCSHTAEDESGQVPVYGAAQGATRAGRAHGIGVTVAYLQRHVRLVHLHLVAPRHLDHPVLQRDGTKKHQSVMCGAWA